MFVYTCLVKKLTYFYKSKQLPLMYILPGGKRKFVVTDDQLHILVIDTETNEILEIIDKRRSDPK
jgi:hypothetical protein